LELTQKASEECEYNARRSISSTERLIKEEYEEHSEYTVKDVCS
jgi:hypothetical protein